MSTAALHARDRSGVFAETPAEILTACRNLLKARHASLECEGDYCERERLSDLHREAKDEAERVIGDHQGASYLNGLYRVDGWLVGFRKVNKGGMTLVVYPTAETKKGTGR